jgi:hypothetical protein
MLRDQNVNVDIAFGGPQFNQLLDFINNYTRTEERKLARCGGLYL